MIKSFQHGTGFALDIFDNTRGEAHSGNRVQLSKVFTLDHQPAVIHYHKSILFISTSHPQSLIYVMDAQLMTKLAIINLNDVAKSICIIEKPLYQNFDMLVVP